MEYDEMEIGRMRLATDDRSDAGHWRQILKLICAFTIGNWWQDSVATENAVVNERTNMHSPVCKSRVEKDVLMGETKTGRVAKGPMGNEKETLVRQNSE